jgi:hypothetical protein
MMMSYSDEINVICPHPINDVVRKTWNDPFTETTSEWCT